MSSTDLLEEPSAPSVPTEYEFQQEVIDEASPLISDASINSTYNTNVPLNVQIQSGLIHENKLYCCCFKRPVYVCCAILSLGLWGSILAYLITRNDYYFIPVIFSIAYTLEVLFCRTSRYLWNLNLVEDVVTYVNRIKATQPVIAVHCKCSHKERKVRTINKTRYDANNRFQGYETVYEYYWETVVTHTDFEYITYSRFEDQSGHVTDQILECNAVRIEYTKNWSYGNHPTQTLVENQIANFHWRSRCRDLDYEHWINFDIHDFKENMLSIVDLEKRPAMLRWLAYAAVSLLLGASWFYRFWFSRKTAKGLFTFIKSYIVTHS